MSKRENDVIVSSVAPPPSSRDYGNRSLRRSDSFFLRLSSRKAFPPRRRIREKEEWIILARISDEDWKKKRRKMSTVATPVDGLRRRPRRWLAPATSCAPRGRQRSHRPRGRPCRRVAVRCTPDTVRAFGVAAPPRNTLLRGPAERRLLSPAACYRRPLVRRAQGWPSFPPSQDRKG